STLMVLLPDTFRVWVVLRCKVILRGPSALAPSPLRWFSRICFSLSVTACSALVWGKPASRICCSRRSTGVSTTLASSFTVTCVMHLSPQAATAYSNQWARAAAVAIPWLERHGFAVTTYEPRPGRVNVIARRPGAEPGPTLLWCGHLDVVAAGDPSAWPHPPCAAVLDGGRLYGRGAVDMKGPVAAALGAAAALARLGGPRRGTLVLALVADEEAMGRHGAGWLARRGLLRADGAIVGEPTRLHLVRAQRGAAWIHLRLRGRPAHAATPHLGASAVAAAARLVLALEERVGDVFHPLLGPPTAVVGRIRGGDSPNRVPERCDLVVDRRAVPGETEEGVRREVQALIGEVLRRHPGVTATITRWRWAEPAETPEDAAVVQVVRAAVRAVTGQDPPEAGTVAVTDMRYLVRAGIPTVIFGPGRPDLAHAPGEFIPVEELA